MRVPGRQELPLSVPAAEVLEEPAAQGSRLSVRSSSITPKHSLPPQEHPSSAPGSLDLLPLNPTTSPTHGSGSRLLAFATKLKGMKPS